MEKPLVSKEEQTGTLTKEQIEALRESVYLGYTGYADVVVCDELISSLSRVEGERDEAEKQILDLQVAAVMDGNKLDSLRAENQRLREALGPIMLSPASTGYDSPTRGRCFEMEVKMDDWDRLETALSQSTTPLNKEEKPANQVKG